MKAKVDCISLIFLLHLFHVFTTLFADECKNKNGNCFQCLEGKRRRNIPHRQVCDGWFDCKDLSDEFLCPLDTVLPEDVTKDYIKTVSKQLNFVLKNTSLVVNEFLNEIKRSFLGINKISSPFTAIDLSHSYCKNTKSEKQEEINKEACEVCKEGEIICPTFNDSTHWYPDRLIVLRNHFLSKIETNITYKRCVKIHEICDKKVDCQYGGDEIFCRGPPHPGGPNKNIKPPMSNKPPRTRQKRSIVNRKQISCGRLFQHFNQRPRLRFTTPPMRPTFSLIQRHLFNNLSIQNNSFSQKNNFNSSWLNGILKNMSQFSDLMKNSHISNHVIYMEQLCDGEIDCENNLDEKFCPGRFYCEGGKPMYVSLRKKMDGVADCADGSDEWTMKKSIKTMASREHMFKDKILQVLVWLVGFIALLGNLFVLFNSVTELLSIKYPGRKFRVNISVNNYFSCKTNSSTNTTLPKRLQTGRNKLVKICNLMLVLNLALADFLMGVYLLILGVISATNWGGKWNDKDYWKYDVIWRTSGTCQGLGVIVMTSSLTSVYTLFGLTTLRLYTVIRPFSTKYLKPKLVLIYCFIVWITAVLLSLMPLLPAQRPIYTTEAWVPFPHFKPQIIDRDAAEMLVGSVTMLFPDVGNEGFDPSDWNSMNNIISKIAPQYAEWKYFGFYSAHSVCMPKLFVGMGEAAWQYTVFFLTVNFLVVIYITTTYIYIYYKTAISFPKRAQTTKNRPNDPTSSYSRSESNSNDKNGTPNISPISGTDVCEDNLLQVTSVTSTLSNPNIAVLKSDDLSTSSERKSSTVTQLSEIGGTPQRRRRSQPGTRNNPRRTSQMQSRIAMLVITDCICWLPICVMCFVRLAGIDIPSVAYSISAIILLPINSALNPILYSRFAKDVFAKIIFIRSC